MNFHLPVEIQKLLSAFISRNEFTKIESSTSEMGEWFVTMENEELELTVSRDRGGAEHIEIGSKARPRKGAPLRSWSLSHLRGYEDGLKSHYEFDAIADQIEWLESHEKTILNSEMLNSEDLRKWAVKASRRIFNR